MRHTFCISMMIVACLSIVQVEGQEMTVGATPTYFKKYEMRRGTQRVEFYIPPSFHTYSDYLFNTSIVEQGAEEESATAYSSATSTNSGGFFSIFTGAQVSDNPEDNRATFANRSIPEVIKGCREKDREYLWLRITFSPDTHYALYLLPRKIKNYLKNLPDVSSDHDALPSSVYNAQLLLQHGSYASELLPYCHDFFTVLSSFIEFKKREDVEDMTKREANRAFCEYLFRIFPYHKPSFDSIAHILRHIMRYYVYEQQGMESKRALYTEKVRALFAQLYLYEDIISSRYRSFFNEFSDDTAFPSGRSYQDVFQSVLQNAGERLFDSDYFPPTRPLSSQYHTMRADDRGAGEYEKVSDALSNALRFHFRPRIKEQEKEQVSVQQCVREYTLEEEQRARRLLPRMLQQLHRALTDNHQGPAIKNIVTITPQEFRARGYTCLDDVLDAIEHPEEVEGLDLSGCNLGRIEGSPFKRFVNLRLLCLSGCNITHLDENALAIGNAPDMLTHLRSEDNQSSEEGQMSAAAASPQELAAHERLYAYPFHEYEFQQAQNSPLVLVDLSYNNITHVPEDLFSKAMQVRYVDLSHNQITHARHLPDFAYLAQARNINIAHNNCGGSVSGNIFWNNTDLRILDISHNTFSFPLAAFLPLHRLTMLFLEKVESVATPEEKEAFVRRVVPHLLMIRLGKDLDQNLFPLLNMLQEEHSQTLQKHFIEESGTFIWQRNYQITAFNSSSWRYLPSLLNQMCKAHIISPEVRKMILHGYRKGNILFDAAAQKQLFTLLEEQIKKIEAITLESVTGSIAGEKNFFKRFQNYGYYIFSDAFREEKHTTQVQQEVFLTPEARKALAAAQHKKACVNVVADVAAGAMLATGVYHLTSLALTPSGLGFQGLLSSQGIPGNIMRFLPIASMFVQTPLSLVVNGNRYAEFIFNSITSRVFNNGMTSFLQDIVTSEGLQGTLSSATQRLLMTIGKTSTNELSRAYTPEQQAGFYAEIYKKLSGNEYGKRILKDYQGYIDNMACSECLPEEMKAGARELVEKLRGEAGTRIKQLKESIHTTCRAMRLKHAAMFGVGAVATEVAAYLLNWWIEHLTSATTILSHEKAQATAAFSIVPQLGIGLELGRAVLSALHIIIEAQVNQRRNLYYENPDAPAAQSSESDQNASAIEESGQLEDILESNVYVADENQASQVTARLMPFLKNEQLFSAFKTLKEWTETLKVESVDMQKKKDISFLALTKPLSEWAALYGSEVEDIIKASHMRKSVKSIIEKFATLHALALELLDKSTSYTPHVLIQKSNVREKKQDKSLENLTLREEETEGDPSVGCLIYENLRNLASSLAEIISQEEGEILEMNSHALYLKSLTSSENGGLNSIVYDVLQLIVRTHNQLVLLLPQVVDESLSFIENVNTTRGVEFLSIDETPATAAGGGGPHHA